MSHLLYDLLRDLPVSVPGPQGEEHDKKCKSDRVTESKMSRRSSSSIVMKLVQRDSEQAGVLVSTGRLTHF